MSKAKSTPATEVAASANLPKPGTTTTPGQVPLAVAQDPETDDAGRPLDDKANDPTEAPKADEGDEA